MNRSEEVAVNKIVTVVPVLKHDLCRNKQACTREKEKL